MKHVVKYLILILTCLFHFPPITPAEDDKVYVNTIGMEFIYVPPGTFVMGNDEDPFEKKHDVILTKGFYIQTTEVTQGQWKEVMGNYFPRHETPYWGKLSVINLCRHMDCPMVNVSWNAVQEFIRILNQKEGADNKYRLPTETEWEYACRARSTTEYYWGDEPDCSKMMCENEIQEIPLYEADEEHDDDWIPTKDVNGICLDYIHSKRPYDISPCSSAPVRSYPPNAWGLYDMHGNVREWCEDIHVYRAYRTHQLYDPVYTGVGSDRVIRGGGWRSPVRSCGCSDRSGSPRDHKGLNTIGFRLIAIP